MHRKMCKIKSNNKINVNKINKLILSILVAY